MFESKIFGYFFHLNEDNGGSKVKRYCYGLVKGSVAHIWDELKVTWSYANVFYHSPLYSRCFITVLTMSSLGKNLSSPIFGVRSFLNKADVIFYLYITECTW